jgi:hypothetical protein
MYGEGRNLRYLAGMGLVILLLFVIIFMIIRGGGNDKVPETKRELTSYVEDTTFTVSETIIGPITAAEKHNEIQISVTNQSANIEISKGYDGNVIRSNTYPLTTNGFGEFLSALEKAGYSRGDTADSLKDDKGFCPTGLRYIFEARDGSDTIQRFWATSCRGTKSYKGDLPLTLQLFEKQIPDYNNVTQDVDM